MNIAFNINNKALEGFGATLTSLIRNCSNNKELRLWILCTDLKNEDKNNIKTLLKDENYNGELIFKDFDAKKEFGHLRSLLGDWTTYGRLLLANYINEDKVLYLDADLVVQIDVLVLKTFNLLDNLLAAANPNTVISQLDNPFLIEKLNWHKDTPYFNAGVVLINLKKWRDEDYDLKWREISSRYPNDLISHDQTLLNVLCEGKFALLPSSFNNFWVPGQKNPSFDHEKSILHFVGSPKPWDYFGKVVHYGFSDWKMYNTKFWKNKYGKITINKLIRTYDIRRSIIKKILIRFKK